MTQVIVTRYHKPTNTKGARVSAHGETGQITLPWDYELDVAENHEAAAKTLAKKMGWRGRWRSGVLPVSGDHVHVQENGNVYFRID